MMKTIGILLVLGTIASISRAKPYSKKGSGHNKDKIFRFDPAAPRTLPKKVEDIHWKSWETIKPVKNEHRVESVTEKKHVTHDKHQGSSSCKEQFCHYGRECKEYSNGKAACVCAGKDYCKRPTNKMVCGSDGVMYASHCELHRHACIKSMHIRIDHSGKKCGSKYHVKHEDEFHDGNIEVRLEKLPKHKHDKSSLKKKLDKKKEKKHSKKKDLKADYKFKDDLITLKPMEKVMTLDRICSDIEWNKLKDKLLDYHCARVGEKDCLKDPIRKQFVANIMFNYYDRNTNQLLDEAELDDIEHRDHLEKLSTNCHLTDILTFDDKEDSDGNISMEEFYKAFRVPTVVLEEHLKVFSTVVTTGNSVELKCDIHGSTSIVWKRNGVDLNTLDSKEIKVFDDGSLYIQDLGVHHIGNYTCQDEYNEHVVQTHILKVHVPPKVTVNPKSQFSLNGADVSLKCHAEGIPEPQILWEMNEVPLSADVPHGHYDRMHNNATLVIRTASYTKDTGAYKCKAHNDAGTAEGVATIFVEDSLDNSYHSQVDNEEFVVFHDGGYTIYNPARCNLEHKVSSSFTNFKIKSDYGQPLPTLCSDKKGCSWGDAVNVADKFIYISQPKLNRIVVINVKDRGNPVEVISTDKVPVSLHYVEYLDQVWALCWNGDSSSGSKTMVVIRQASKSVKHHVVHTQPVGNHFDMVKDIFLPPSNDLKHKFKHGYVVHNEQRGLHKLDLETMKYVKVIDLNDYNCVPIAVSFVPLGGKILVYCHSPVGEPQKTSQLILDYVTDAVLEHNDIHGEPYVSPDGRHIITIDEVGNNLRVFRVTDQGELKHVFDEYTNLHVSDVTFFPSERGRGYDFYASSANKNDVLYVNLETGKVEMIEGVGQAMDKKDWPWNKHNRSIISGGIFGNYLVTPSKDSIIVIDGRRRHVQCEWPGVAHGNVMVWVHLKEL